MQAKLSALILLTCWSINFCFGQTTQEINWLNKQIQPIESVNPDHSSDDLKPFRQIVQ